MDLQGFRTGIQFGPEQDAIIHTADGISHFAFSFRQYCFFCYHFFCHHTASS